MTPSDRAGRRGRLLAAVSVLGVSLGMAGPALARDPTAVENPTGGQVSQKTPQTSMKEQTSLKAPVSTTVQTSMKEQTSLKAPSQNTQKGATAWDGGVGGAPTSPAP